ncbi:Uncharacterized protein BP5553_09634 [Venustampulla echinocandica]|uniref:Uncharacterized protein n=1 Tax=Venustampulla echinocandica TaxID=2656787 RepID=A0A370TBK0_9HELO|nr:Uncharacterized protein BP5553_09634 [Venustampulla echinocandica]RDL31425.1 Uncharacterized protein BP5553_09634 [Venustampulla echinocandica]
MSVFSKIRQSRAAAKQHKAKAKEPTEDVKVPYKHVPKHAAVDALSGAPSTWKHEDKGKIRQHHQRRSQMGSRTTSMISTASYFTATAGPSSAAPPLPRNNSYTYSSYSPAWLDRGGDYHNAEPTRKRYKSRGHSYNDSGIGASIGPSPLASNMHSEDVSPVISSGDSSSSNSSDHLELAPASNSKRRSQQRPQPEKRDGYSTPNMNRTSQRPQPVVYAEKDIFERLHTSTTRKIGEAPLYDSPPSPVKGSVATTTVAPAVEERKPKKSRWSLLGKKRNSAIVA